MSLQSINTNLTLPDLWQQDSVRNLQHGKDVVVDAPTGAGKTYIFELLVESRKLDGQAIFTVPTRALANDKLLEWRAKGWNVGIATGDIAENLDAPVIVATLETQKYRLLRRERPRLIVIDEYQMIADASRGVNYEMVIAIAPKETQFLFLSGSVNNPQEILSWLKRIGRDAVLISHKERPVPQEQIYLDALPDRAPKSVFGYWPRYIARALLINLDPILIFAPQRKDSERIARQIASVLPLDDPLELSAEQRAIAGERLTKLLKTRVAYHHSGLSYKQRAGVIEPLAKAGQLRVVVATTGLGAGINFSMRSVIVADREFRQYDKMEQVRPDELLQMFGRAGRRGLDERGYILVLPEKPRLEDAEPIQLRRAPQLDWPSFLSLMYQAQNAGQEPVTIANTLADSLFSTTEISLGFDRDASILQTQSSNNQCESKSERLTKNLQNKVIEILSSEGKWERRKGPLNTPLGETLYYKKGKWLPATSVAFALSPFDIGTTCIIKKSPRRTYGKEWVVAHFPTKENHDKVILSKKYRKALRELNHRQKKPFSIPKQSKLETLEKLLKQTIPAIYPGARVFKIDERKGAIVAKIDLSNAMVIARKDSHGKRLFAPPKREIINEYQRFSLKEHISADATNDPQTPRELWQNLGLIDETGQPTRRGAIFSFFNHGEGLAVAAALEDEDYPIEQLIWDLANLRAGHRFDQLGDFGSRLSYVCREAFGSQSHPGYLRRGLPEDYGEGAAELVFNNSKDPKWKQGIVGDDIKTGDIERVILEWKSILRQISHAPEFPWNRWLELQMHIRERLQIVDHNKSILDLPPLTSKQRSRKPIPLKWNK